MKKGGFILLDTLLALVLVGVILVYSMYSTGVLIRGLSASGKYLEASAVSQAAFAEFIGKKDRAVAEFNLPAGFEVKSEITPFNSNLDQCSIAVSWNDSGRADSVKIYTYKAKIQADGQSGKN